MNKQVEKNFESALKRLEQISDLLENEETPLEESIKLFEEGIELKEYCEEKLKSAKIKIDKIVKKNKSLSSTEFQ
ncbi:exodeoxyribonuclease VII small subunit [Alphaproteobacteria bacterium]|nr:exodeoxyribonuclease VII small subunit [Alphaproteobacteria bacterium]